jgi:hypothetical protein
LHVEVLSSDESVHSTTATDVQDSGWVAIVNEFSYRGKIARGAERHATVIAHVAGRR